MSNILTRKNDKVLPAEIVLLQNGHPEMAIEQLDEKLAKEPNNWEHHVNIGIGYRLTNEFQLALLHQTLATQIKPNMSAAWHNLGVTKTEIGDFEGAFLAHQKAYECEPDNQQVCLGYAYALLRYGKFELAWPLWEQARYHTSFWEVPGIPLWTGAEPLEGKKILVFMEGGYGDAIFFLRWLPELQDRGAEVTLQAFEKQVGIFQGHPWLNAAIPDNLGISSGNEFDFCVSIMSVPALIGSKATAIPAAERYIIAHPDNIRLFRSKVHRGSKPLVGFCWGAEENIVPKRSRSIPDAEIDALKEADVDWISLWPGHRRPWMSEIPVKDWAETAALVTHLDAVVSADTAVLHLAAAMGKQTLGLVPIGSDWKFFRDLETSPWYPSLEVIHNNDPVSWKGAVQRALDGIRRSVGLSHGLSSEHGSPAGPTTSK